MFWDFRVHYYILFCITPNVKKACKRLKPLFFTPHFPPQEKNGMFLCVEMHTASKKSIFVINMKKKRRVRRSESKHLFDTFGWYNNAHSHECVSEWHIRKCTGIIFQICSASWHWVNYNQKCCRRYVLDLWKSTYHLSISCHVFSRDAKIKNSKHIYLELHIA